MKTDTPQTIHLKDYKPSNYLVDKIDLEFDIFDDKTIVKNTMTLSLNPQVKDNNKSIIFNGEDLKLLSFKCDGEDFSDYSIENGKLKFFGKDNSFDLEIVTEIHPEKNTSLMGLYKSGGIFCTQCEAEGFRKITYYYDRPDVLTKFHTKITADKSFKYLLSNGNLIDSGESGDRHWALWEDPHPKPCYLFALVAGDFDLAKDTYTTTSGRVVSLEIYVDKGNLDQVDHAMNSLKQSMKWDEDRFNLEYDLDIYMIVAVDSFNMGAMENKGLNIFNSRYVLGNSVTATDSEYYGIQAVIGHEYFHNWTGNRITCRDWFQLTLKEGLTVFRDREFSSDLNSRHVKRIDDTVLLRALQFPEDNGPFTHPIKPKSYVKMDNFYTSTVYEKGAEVIGMIFTIIGKEKFKEGMAKYFELFDGGAVTTEDFIHSMEVVSGYDFTHFKKWYDVSGTPQIHVEYKKEDEHIFEISQSFIEKSKKDVLEIPLRFKVLNTHLDINLEGDKSFIQNDLLFLKDQKVRLEVKGSEKPLLSLNRGFSAPIMLHQNLTGDERLEMMSLEDDSFNKWDGAQNLYKENILTNALENKNFDSGIIDLIKSVLEDKSLDNHFKGVFISLPLKLELFEMTDKYVFREIEESCEKFLEFINTQLEDEFKKIYQNLSKKNKNIWNAEFEGLRCFKNSLLTYLAKNTANESLILDQFRKSENMTDKLHALKLLNKYSFESRNEANKEFEEMASKYPQLFPNYFKSKVISLKNGVEVFKEILKDENYNKSIPNHIYGAFGSFLKTQQARIYDHSSDVLEFVINQILEIDSYNPQVASRMTKALVDLKKLPDREAEFVRTHIQKLLDHDGLSKDVEEMVNKLLV